MSLQSDFNFFPPSVHALSVLPISEAVEPCDGPINLIYDRTIPRPLRLRDARARKVNGEIPEAVADIIYCVEELMQPFQIHFMRATLSSKLGDAGRYFDGLWTVCVVQLLGAHACDYEVLEGLNIEVSPSLRAKVNGSNAQIDARFNVRLGGDNCATNLQQDALRRYGEWGSALWSKFVAEHIGPWALDGGIVDFRLRGTLSPDPAYGLGRALTPVPLVKPPVG